MSLVKNTKYSSNSSIAIRAEYNNSSVWCVIDGEPMRIQVRLKPFETGYQIVFRLYGTSIELPFTPDMVLCRTKADCDPIIMSQSIDKMLKGEL